MTAANIKAGKKGMTLTKWIESLVKVSITKNTVNEINVKPVITLGNEK